MLTIVSEPSEQDTATAGPTGSRPAAGSPASCSPPDPPPAPPLPTGELLLADLERERETERRNFRRAVLVAVLFHAVLLVITFPELQSRPLEIQRPATVHVVPQMRFKPPPPKGPQEVPKPKKKRIPIPDPTPDEPEPIEVPEVEVPEVDLPPLDDIVFGIPGPPEGLPGAAGEGPYQIGGDVVAPVKIYDLQPRYTEEARKARIQGIVILQGVIDAEGRVTRVEVIKGLTLGLTESAVETVKQWKYKPATRDGKPVPVYYVIRVGFWMQ